MSEFWPLPYQLLWPCGLVIAWMAGEMLHRWTALPRISVYGVVGFLFANFAFGSMAQAESDIFMLLANLAFGLILFELGYRINLQWLKRNPWILVTALVEASASFICVYFIALAFDVASFTAAMLAALAMSTSPAAVLRVVNENASAGQVTERLLHFSMCNCVLAVLTFKVIIGVGLFHGSGDLLHAISNSFAVLLVSAGMGLLMGLLLPAWLRHFTPNGPNGRDATLAFALAVALLVAVTHVLKFSPVLATLTFGIVARHRRISLSRTQRNFGVLGDLLSVLLFFYIATTLKWQHVLAGLPLALVLVFARTSVKVLAVSAFARVSGITLRKAVLTGVALTPMSVFAILLLEQTRRLGVDLVENLLPLAALVLLLEVIGPILTQRALIMARETSSTS